MIVLKFGGSSVANATNMSRVLDIVSDAASKDRVILVSSAISGCTDKLIEGGQENFRALKDAHRKIIRRLFTGVEREEAYAECDALFEELAAAPAEDAVTFGELFSTKILARKLACEGFDARWIDSRDIIVKGDIDRTYVNIAASVADAGVRIFVAPGFIARDLGGHVTTLGRGGSDYSAALFAAGAKADTLQIWTDVPGIMTTNPKVVPAARTIPTISYDAAFCMAEHGAKVLYAPTVAPARSAGIAINIRNTFNPAHPGTSIENVPESGVCEWMGLSDTTKDGRATLYLTAQGPIDAGASLSRVHAALKEAGIEATGCGEGEGYIWAEVFESVRKQACAALHREFFEEAIATSVDVYIAGYGSVGHALERLIRSGIAERGGKTVRIAGISSDHGFADKVLAEAPRRSVFVDCTNSEDIWTRYVPMLEAGINVVSSNRRSLAVPYVEYAAMKQAALRSGSFFRYGTTVGTALPILESIAAEGEVDSLEAVVSCTLNHIITGYDGSRTESFATLLMKAQDAGLTEFDPRLDLGGRDALRKLLILGREAGVPLDEKDVVVTPMLGAEYFDCPLDEFYRKLQAAEPDFIRREDELDEMQRRQRFVASLRRDPASELGYKAEIKMQLYRADSQFYWLSGTENVIEIRGGSSAPLVIKGAGEGAQQAARSILNEILK